ncbi:retrovirus-related pol polyprotein from transposon TNT 1-94 [Tanacetum coccineum]|uniref:Retrovirus-related pol polyprotein from transposon TNT 1-94 n=1 Tax=Tanacetum coccineum TaxID=301880 RepID=A0ABQ5HU46_9ASTR
MASTCTDLNCDIINDLAKDNLGTCLPKFKYTKDHLFLSCEQGKSKKVPHKPKLVSKSKNRLHILHMDLCGLMRVESINRKRYVLVIVDDYSYYTWANFLRSKDEALENDREDIWKLGAKGLDLTYAPSTITSQKPIELELDILFEAMYDDYIGGQPSDTTRTAPVAPATQNLPTPNASTTNAESALTPTNLST